MAPLAIVIPAYKEVYFEKALLSLAKQTSKNFIVYVGDDCSPYNLKGICDKFEHSLDIRYTRFADNLGSVDLVAQWKRCVQLTGSEEWLWLFSDDDIAGENCVESFLKQKNADNGRLDVYRFNTIVIDAQDKVIGVPQTGPAYESSEEMAYYLLQGKRGNTMPDHVFSRKVYVQNGGFVNTYYAQAADWATSILFSKENGIGIVSNANLYWRFSGSNVSSQAPAGRSQMIQGHLQFIGWVTNHFLFLKNEQKQVSYKMMLDAARENLKGVLAHHYKGFDIKNILPIIKIMRRKLGMSYLQILNDLLIILVNTNQFFHMLFQFIQPFKKKNK